MNTKQSVFYPHWGQGLGLFSFIMMVMAAGWLWLSGHMDIRYSADHQGTIPIWTIWIPSLVCIMLIRIMPLHLPSDQPHEHVSQRPLTIESVLFLVGAILFPVFLLLIDQQDPNFQLWYLSLKPTFLIILPWIGVWMIRHRSKHHVITQTPHSLKKWKWIGPICIMIVWFALTYFTPLSKPYASGEITDPITLLIMLFFGFLINSLLEELFYRVWLQTRLERLLGTWPAIFLVSILWSIWHMAIQSVGEWSVDLATVICNQGVIGLFLGYLWSRYRNPWVLIIIHGIMNAHPYLLLSIWKVLV